MHKGADSGPAARKEEGLQNQPIIEAVSLTATPFHLFSVMIIAVNLICNVN